MKHIFLTIPAGAEPGLTSVSIGLVHSLDRIGLDAGFYKPFSQSHDKSEADRSRYYMKAVSDLDPPATVTQDIFQQKILDGQFEELLERVIENTEKLLLQHDLVVIEGLVPDPDLPQADEINTSIARSLGAEIIIVGRSKDESVSEVAQSIEQFVHNLPKAYKRTKPAVILNRLKPLDNEALNFQNFHEKLAAFRAKTGKQDYELIGMIPDTPELGQLRMSDLLKGLNGKLINEGNLDGRRVSSIRICARQVENMLDSFVSGALIVTPSDRSDIIVATALAVQKGVTLAGMILTGDINPSDKVLEFCKQAFSESSGFPVIHVESSSYQIASLLNDLNTEVPIEDEERIKLVSATVARFLDTNWLRETISSDIKRRLSPVAFKHQLSRNARKAEKRILLPEGTEERTITAALECAERRIAKCVLIGDPEKIKARMVTKGNDLPEYLEILNPDDHRQNYVKSLHEMRKHKGMTLEQAEETLEDSIQLATMMVAMGDADGLVSGAEHSTAHTIRPALQLIKPAPGNKVVSSIFFMCLPDQVYIFGDCAINPDPNAEQLAEIAIQSAESALAFGIEPKVAMISYSTLGSGSGSDVEKVMEATRIAKERAPHLLIDGPLQYDAATTPSVAAKKAPNSPVAGQANVIIFPDLNTGNTTYKAVQRSANVASIGPMLQGLNKPVNDLSRGTTVEDIVYTIALTAIQGK